MKEPLTWDFENARTCVLLHKKPYKTGDRKETFFYDENGGCILDYYRRYNEIKKKEGRIAADSARRKWKSKERNSSWETYYVEKYWEISGIVLHRRDDWMYSLDMSLDSRFGILGDYTLEKIISEHKNIMEVQQPPRHCSADWCGLGKCESLMRLVTKRLGIGKTKTDNPHFYPQDEIRLIANETVNAAWQYFEWWINSYEGYGDNPYCKSSLGVRPTDDVRDVISDRLVDLYYDVEKILNELNRDRERFLELVKGMDDGEPDCWKKGFLF